MGMLLTDSDKLTILLLAFCLVLATLVVTSCLVFPRCFLYRRFIKQKAAKKKNTSFGIIYPSFMNGESQHFHLSIVPVYGSQPETRSLASSPMKRGSEQLNEFENLTQLAEKTRMRYSSLKPDNIKVLPLFPKVKARLNVELVGESSFRLHINIFQVYDLKLKEYLVEPSCYVTVVLIGLKSQRKSIISKVTQSEMFRTDTVKKTLNPTFTKSQMVSEKLPKSLLKEGCIKLRVMDEERNANDVCLGEVTLSLKKISILSEIQNPTNEPAINNPAQANCEQSQVPAITVSAENGEPDISTYTLFPIKEVKGELFVGFCYLPTSKRINITVVKANLRHPLTQPSNSSVHQAFYTRILMFNNGKLIKKKKTSLSVRSVWGENETISFDLNDEPFHLISFMLVLSCKLQNSTTPSSPESPQSPEANKVEGNSKPAEPSRTNSTCSSSSRKDCHVGHFVLDKDIWLEEIIKKPRKQVLKWFKLY